LVGKRRRERDEFERGAASGSGKRVKREEVPVDARAFVDSKGKWTKNAARGPGRSVRTPF